MFLGSCVTSLLTVLRSAHIIHDSHMPAHSLTRYCLISRPILKKIKTDALIQKRKFLSEWKAFQIPTKIQFTQIVDILYPFTVGLVITYDICMLYF